MKNRDKDQKKNGRRASEQTGREPLNTKQVASIPVIEEQIKVDKELVETGRVRITKNVDEEQKTVDLFGMQEEVDVERVAVNQYVDRAPAVRHEGDKMIIPVMREVEVVEKRLVLVEELHVSKRQVKTNEQQEITLRREEVSIDRSQKEGPTS